MKRSFFYTALVLTTVCLATSSRTFGDSKVRIGGGGSGRGQVGSHNGPSASSVNARPRGLSGNNGHQNSGHQNSGNHSSHSHNGGSGNSGKGLGGFHVGNQGVKWPQASNGHADSHGDSGKPIIKFPGQSGHGQSGHGQPGHGGRPNFNAPLPPNLHNKIGHTIPGLNGTKLKPVGINVDHILKHHGPSNHAQPQIQNIVASAPKHLSSHQHFSWWVSTCHSHCHTNYGCWNTNSSYWDCWTPCNWQVVQCEQFSFYVGLGCVHMSGHAGLRCSDSCQRFACTTGRACSRRPDSRSERPDGDRSEPGQQGSQQRTTGSSGDAKRLTIGSPACRVSSTGAERFVLKRTDSDSAHKTKGSTS